MALRTDVAFPTFTKTRQAYQYQALHDYNGKRLRVTVYRDTHAFQSWARVEVWSKTDDRWNTVASRLGEQIDHLPSPYQRDEAEMRDRCESLASDLLAEAKFTLGS